MSLVPTVSYAYAALLLVGGLMGYVKGNSLPSLIAGGGSAALLAALEHFGRGQAGTNLGQAGVAGGLFFMMLKRFAASGKFMPAGLTAAASWVALGAFLARHFLSAAGSKSHTN